MVKYPEPGMVKTRLARHIGEEKAALISKQLAESVIKKTIPVSDGYDRFVFCDPPGRIHDFASWLPGEKLIAQAGIDVGERMYNALRHLLENGAEKAVITGTDIPDLTGKVIIKAFELLELQDVVIGPAADGGYYLIGMKSSISELFYGINWSTEDVFIQTVRTLEHSGISYGVLPVLSDLDTFEDLNQFVL